MAVIHTNQSAYTNENNRALKLAVLFGSIAVLLWLYWMWRINNHERIWSISNSWSYFFALGLTGWLGVFFWRQYSAAVSGDQGIERALNVLSKLPDDYHVFTNIVEDNTYFGIVVAGPRGVFVVNVKNHNGEIIPSDEREWEQHKIGRRGTQYVSKMRNPIGQLKRQIYVLATTLKAHGINVWVDGIVYFTNPTITLHGSFDKYTNTSDTVLSFILSYPCRKNVTAQKLQQITEFLLR